MRFIDQAIKDLQEIKQRLNTGIASFVFNYALTADSISYRQELIQKMELAIEMAEIKGDDELYNLYQKGVNELLISWAVKPILAKTLAGIEEGAITRHSSLTLLEEERKANQSLQAQNEKLKSLVLAQQNHLNNYIQAMEPYQESVLEIDNSLTASMIINFEHVSCLAEQYRYQEVMELLKSLSDRCIQLTSDNKLVSNGNPIFELINAENKIKAILAQQVLAKLKEYFRSASALNKLFWRDENEDFYSLLHQLIEYSDIDILTSLPLKNQEDLFVFVEILRDLIIEYRKHEKWHQKPADYAKVILNRSLHTWKNKFTTIDNLSPSQQEELNLQLVALRQLKSELDSELAHVKTELMSEGGKKTIMTGFFSTKSQEIVSDIISSPVDHLFAVGELLISPATAVAKQLGKAHAELKEYKKQVQASPGISIDKHKEFYERLKNTILLLDKVIVLMESVQTQRKISVYLAPMQKS